MGGWIENGSDSDKSPKGDHYRPLDDFRAPGNGRNEYVLKNLYIYFWRWATWKVFNADQALADGDVGVVCYITTSGYLRGPGFKGMREYLRRTTSEGWIIDVSPEGMRPDVSTRIFPGVQQPLAIAMFTRRANCDPNVPAPVHYTALHGTRVEKYADLAKLGLDDEHWRDARTDWQAPFTPAAESAWDDFPAVNDLLPWSSPGVKGNRTWIIAPAVDVLKRRWGGLRQASSENSPAYFKDSGGSRLDQPKSPLPGSDVEQDTAQPLASQFPQSPAIVRYGFRFLDRQWIIADHRVIDRARLHLWAARRDGQVFVIEQHAEAIDNGPGLVFSALIPDMHHFNNRGGRTLPLLHPGGRANLAKGLLGALSTLAGLPITADDVVAYMAGVTSHPGFTARFTDELTTPGVRVPITADPELFNLAVSLGKEVVWAHTYGAAFPDAAAGRPSDDVRFSPDDERRVANLAAVDSMPSAMAYDPATQLLELGDGTFGPVPQEAWEYTIGGKNVLRSWFNYRKASPTGRKSSPLDDVNADSWPVEWTSELLDLLSVLARLVEVHTKQAVLLEQILAGPIVSRNMLAGTGVTWPGGDKDPQRRPDYLSKREDFESTDDGQMGFTFA